MLSQHCVSQVFLIKYIRNSTGCVFVPYNFNITDSELSKSYGITIFLQCNYIFLLFKLFESSYCINYCQVIVLIDNLINVAFFISPIINKHLH